MITREKKQTKTTKKKVDTYEIEWYDLGKEEQRTSTVITSEMFYIIFDTLQSMSKVQKIVVWAVMSGQKKLINDPEKQVMDYMRNAVMNMLDEGYNTTEISDGKDKGKS